MGSCQGSCSSGADSDVIQSAIMSSKVPIQPSAYELIPVAYNNEIKTFKPESSTESLSEETI